MQQITNHRSRYFEYNKTDKFVFVWLCLFFIYPILTNIHLTLLMYLFDIKRTWYIFAELIHIDYKFIIQIATMKAKKKSSKKSKNKSKVNKTNGTGKAEWKKIKLVGNLLSDEGGIGLEGLLGLEVLENAGDVVSVLKEKYVKEKKEKFTISDDESGSDDDRSNKKNRRKKQQKLKKEKNKENSSDDNRPGKFVRAVKAGSGEATKKPKKGKGNKAKKIAEPIEASQDEEKITINDLIVSIQCIYCEKMTAILAFVLIFFLN